MSDDPASPPPPPGNENASDGSNGAPPPQHSSSGSSESPPAPSSGGTPPSQGSSSPSPPPPSPPSPPPPATPSQSSVNGGDSPPAPNQSPPPQQSSPSPPPPSSSDSGTPPAPSSGGSPSSSGASPPPSPPQESNGSNNKTSGSPPAAGGQSSQPATPTVFVVKSPPGALPLPGVVPIIPPGAAVFRQEPPGVMQPGSSGSKPSGRGGSSPPSSSEQVTISSHVAGAIVGAAVGGLLFVIIAVSFVMSRRRRRKIEGLVYHQDGAYHPAHSGQFVGSTPPSGQFYAPPPPGALASFSYGPPPPPADFGHHRSSSMEQGAPGSKSCFSYEELTSITSNFSRGNVIGEGGFGYVYKGWLADGKCVAVKQLKAGSGQGEREFQAEVEIISRVHHRHLVSLVGYCVAQHHRMLIYEFVPNGTLEHHLHDRGVPVMDWSTRLRIAIGAAKGLAYLHEDCHPRIIHRDIKSANILLDYSFEAQVADFGLAKLSNDTHTHVSTRIMGTFGYLAPEYACSGKLTDRSDVFSFGVVLLELITGRKPVDQTRDGEESLVEWARPVLSHAVETGEFGELVDPRLEGRYNKVEMRTMVVAAAACVRHSAPKRPRMVQVMRALDVDVEEGKMADPTNGVKVGQSRAFASTQQEAALDQLRRTAFASQEFSGEFDHSGDGEDSTDSETRPMNRRPPPW